MPWFSFDRDFDYRVSPTTVVAYRGGTTLLVPMAHADAAAAAGAGKRVPKPAADAAQGIVDAGA